MIVKPATLLKASSKLFVLALAWLTFHSMPAQATGLGADIIYIGNVSTPAIERVDSLGNASVFGYTGFYPPTALALDPNGNLYASTDGNVIQKWSPNGNSTPFASSGISTPTALAFDHSGNLYVANAGNNTIEKFDASGHGSVFGHTGAIQPYGGMAFDNSGNLYVATEGNYQIEKFDPQGNVSFFASIAAPYCMTFDGVGHLYVGTGLDQIYKLDLQGHATLFANSGLNGPAGLAFDSAGNLYALNGNNRTITRFDANGNPSLFASPGFYLRSIAIQLVPEPSVSALVLLALGASIPIRRRLNKSCRK